MVESCNNCTEGRNFSVTFAKNVLQQNHIARSHGPKKTPVERCVVYSLH